MKNNILLIVFILLLGSCSFNNDPTYRILRVENDKQLETSNKMLENNYVLTYSFGKSNDAKYEYFLYQKFSNVSNIVYLPKNEFYKDSVDFQEVISYTIDPIIKSSDTITTSDLFNNINKNQPNLLLRQTFDSINIYIPVYSPVFYQKILFTVALIMKVTFDFSNFYFKTIPQQDILIYNDEDGEVIIKKLENTLNNIYTKENLLFLRIEEDGFIFIGEK